jgi:hypothetical protein
VARSYIAWVIIVSGILPSAGTTVATRQLTRWVLEEELRYPSSITAPLTDVEQIVPARDGSIYVIDSQSHEILVFDERGLHARSLGREGRGPGEFLGPWRMGLLGQGLWVIDSGSWTVSTFDANGAVEAVQRPLRDASLRADAISTAVYAVLADRAVLILEEPVAAPGRYRLLRMSPDGATLDSLGVLFASDRDLAVPLAVQGGGAVNLRNKFSHSDMLAVSPTGERIVVVERPEPEAASAAVYRVRFVRPTGEVVSVIEVPYEVVTLTARDLDRWIEGHGALRQMVESGLFPSMAAAERAMQAALDPPAFCPPIPNLGRGILEDAIVVSREGQVWVERWEREEASGTRWDVIAEGPGRVATAEVPPGIRLLAVAGDRAWGVELDEYDVPTIVRYRIIR